MAETADMAGKGVRAKTRRVWLGKLPMVLLGAALFFLLVWPVVMLIYGIFQSLPPGQGGQWTLENARSAYGSSGTYSALLGSVIFAASTTVLATAFGAYFAYLSTRTSVPGVRLIAPMMLVILALPTVLYAISWSILANPEVGLINEPIKAVFGSSPINAQSWLGMIFVQAWKLTSFAYFLLLAPFSAMNRSFEEAAMTSGAGRLRTFAEINLPILTPALFGVVIVLAVFGLGAFDIPQILGTRAGVETLATRIFYFVAGSVPPEYGAASALAVFMLLALILLLFVQSRVERGRSFVTVTGKSYNANRWDLGRWNRLATVSIVGFALVAMILPGIQVVLTSFQSTMGLMENFTTANFEKVLGDARTPAAFRLSGLLAVGGGFAAMILAYVIAVAVRSSRTATRRYFDLVTLAPIVMPGVILSIGFLWAYITLPGFRDLYGTVWLCAIALMVASMPIASRVATSALAQLSPELLEAAQTSGAGRIRVVWDVVRPLLSGSFLAGWMLCGVMIVGALDIPLMLLPATDPNVAVLVYGLSYSAFMPTQASAMLVLLMVAIFAVGAIYLVLAKLKRYFRGSGIGVRL